MKNVFFSFFPKSNSNDLDDDELNQKAASAAKALEAVKTKTTIF